MSAASLADELCGEEFNEAYELDKPIVIVTPARAKEIPSIMQERGSMSMMIEAKMKDIVAFGDTHLQAATNMTIARVFNAVAASHALSALTASGDGDAEADDAGLSSLAATPRQQSLSRIPVPLVATSRSKSLRAIPLGPEAVPAPMPAKDLEAALGTLNAE